MRGLARGPGASVEAQLCYWVARAGELEREVKRLLRGSMFTPYSEHDVHVVAQTLLGEAEGEGIEGMRAVAHVVRNRVRDSRWPGGYAAVCVQPTQFTCWNRDSVRLPRMIAASFHDALYRTAYWLAARVMAGDDERDPTKGANHYHARSIPRPSWAAEKYETGVIGNHVFYDIPHNTRD